jgi:hypothetical protein
MLCCANGVCVIINHFVGIKRLFAKYFYRDEVKNQQIEKILQHRQKDQAALVMSLLEEESWQYQAFSSLLSQRDRRTTQLSEDIRAVIDQLNQLTAWELQRKSRKIDMANVRKYQLINFEFSIILTFV